MKKIKTSQKIISYIKKKGQASGHELSDYLNISSRAVRKQLNNLLKDNKIYKIGKPPKVFYLLVTSSEKQEIVIKNKKNRDYINQNYLIVTPSGEIKKGVDGFIYWCAKNRISVEKTASEYVKTKKKFDAVKKIGLIDGMEKIKSSFKNIYLDKVFYLDFYSIERFGKTKLGQLLLYAKQSQNKLLIKELTKEIKPKITSIIKKYNIDGVGYIPPTVKRELQFINELKKNLNLKKHILNIVKVKTQIIVPQKTLNKLQDRIENVRNTIIVDENKKYNNILLIDDAVGSGATLNQTAKKIKSQQICKGKIIGLAITGSFKGFDVISEV